MFSSCIPLVMRGISGLSIPIGMFYCVAVCYLAMYGVFTLFK